MSLVPREIGIIDGKICILKRPDIRLGEAVDIKQRAYNASCVELDSKPPVPELYLVTPFGPSFAPEKFSVEKDALSISQILKHPKVLAKLATDGKIDGALKLMLAVDMSPERQKKVVSAALSDLSELMVTISERTRAVPQSLAYKQMLRYQGEAVATLHQWERQQEPSFAKMLQKAARSLSEMAGRVVSAMTRANPALRPAQVREHTPATRGPEVVS